MAVDPQTEDLTLFAVLQRKPWSTPRVIVSEVPGDTGKTHGSAINDIHTFYSNGVS